MIPVAMVFLTIGLMLLGVGVGWEHLPLTTHLSRETNDFLRGALFGLSIALETGALVIALSAAAAKKAPENAPVPRP